MEQKRWNARRKEKLILEYLRDPGKLEELLAREQMSREEFMSMLARYERASADEKRSSLRVKAIQEHRQGGVTQ